MSVPTNGIGIKNVRASAPIILPAIAPIIPRFVPPPAFEPSPAAAVSNISPHTARPKTMPIVTQPQIGVSFQSGLHAVTTIAPPTMSQVPGNPTSVMSTQIEAYNTKSTSMIIEIQSIILFTFLLGFP